MRKQTATVFHYCRLLAFAIAGMPAPLFERSPEAQSLPPALAKVA